MKDSTYRLLRFKTGQPMLRPYLKLRLSIRFQLILKLESTHWHNKTPDSTAWSSSSKTDQPHNLNKSLKSITTQPWSKSNTQRPDSEPLSYLSKSTDWMLPFNKSAVTYRTLRALFSSLKIDWPPIKESLRPIPSQTQLKWFQNTLRINWPRWPYKRFSCLRKSTDSILLSRKFTNISSMLKITFNNVKPDSVTCNTVHKQLSTKQLSSESHLKSKLKSSSWLSKMNDSTESFWIFKTVQLEFKLVSNKR